MSKARNLADLLDASGDVSVGALDNVPPSNDASALTTGTLPVDRVPYVGRRNLIINGDFQVWQRGTVGTAVNGFSINSADRWYSVRTQLNQETDSYGNPYAHCVCGNWADSNYIQHKVEFPRKLLGKTLTLSFWIKSDDGLGDDGLIYIRYYTGSSYETPCLEEFTFGTEWKKIVATFNMPTTSVASDNYGLEIFLEGNDSTTNHNGKSFDIKEVQLELGSVATPFEHRSYGEELALCQRYFEKGTTYNICVGNGESDHQVGYIVTKRANATITLSNQLNVTNHSNTANYLHAFYLNGSGASYANYIYDWTADAEL